MHRGQTARGVLSSLGKREGVSSGKIRGWTEVLGGMARLKNLGRIKFRVGSSFSFLVFWGSV